MIWIFLLGCWCGGMVPVALQLWDEAVQDEWRPPAFEWIAIVLFLLCWPLACIWGAMDIARGDRP